MKTKDFLKKYEACCDGARWALSISEDMADVWDAMLSQEKREWLIWVLTRPGVFPDSVLRKLACRFVRETPLLDGSTVWALLEDNRSRKAVEVAERFADGEATKEERKSAYAAARASADAAYAAADAAADYAAYVAARATAEAARAAYAAADAADVAYAAHAAYAAAEAAYAADAAYAHAKAAQIKMIADLGNPFK